MREVITENTLELKMGEMRQIYEQEAIKLHTSVRPSPESNGVAERTIGVLTNAVLTMLHDLGLPQILWAEAYNPTTYVHNRTPTRALDGRTPCEGLYGAKAVGSYLRAFGVLCAIVEPKGRLRKLDDRATQIRRRRLWAPKRRVVVESKEFEELFLRTACCRPLSMASRPGPSTRTSQ